ncbi:MAG: hypothetical protein K8I27_14980 [Planctomycetes bacterium]|nr:hypothetical protein [Planctomycetota bacterium]
MVIPSRKRVWIRRLFVLAYAVILTIGITWPLLTPWFYDQHESLHYMTRLGVLAEGWASQGVHPRWSPELAAGHGYPLFNFYSPGFSYLGLLFLPLGEEWAVKSVVVVATLLGILCLYGLGRSLSGFAGGLVAATLCVTAPYTLYNIHSRGDFSEYVAFFVAAGVLWSLLHALRRRMSWGATLVFVTAYGAFVPIHTISSLVYSVVFALLGGAYALRKRFAARHWVRLVGAFAVGLMLSAWYWLPALTERHLVSTHAMIDGHYVIENNFAPSISRYFVGFTRSAPIVGPVITGALAFVLVTACLAGRHRFQMMACLVVCAACILLNFPVSEPFWHNIPLVRYVQFPWRLNALVVLFAAIGVGLGARRLPRGLRRTPLTVSAMLFAAVSVVALGLALGKIDWTDPQPADYQATPARWLTTSGKEEFLPRGARREGIRLSEPLIQGAPRVLMASQTGTSVDAVVDAPHTTTVTVRQWAYPGWHARVDGQQVEWHADAAGRLTVTVPQGKHELHLELRRSGVQLASEWASAVTALLLMCGLAYTGLRRRRGQKEKA